ncbi:MAG: glycosyltransferase family 2 protein [Halobacteriovoraceae bacterium]|nr:glycosyltransferase family 2 protein [Halobacteriovoraceae bacterium]
MNQYWQTDSGHYEQSLLDYCQKHVTVVICALNEEKTIKEVILTSRPYCSEIIVVDGHSKDSTREIAADNGARIIKDGKRGKGDAVRMGIMAARGDSVVFIDADMSHNPDDIPKLIDPIMNDRADCVIGSRLRGGSDEFHGDINKFLRRVGSDIITMGINYRFGVQVTDSQNGFRSLKTSIARKLDLKENITTIEQEITIKVLKKKFRLSEVPIHEFKRKYGKSKIKLSKVSFQYVYSWLRYLLF